MDIVSKTQATADCDPFPSAFEVRGQLSHILASKHFEASPRNRRFLQYIVEECTEGRSHLIKGYSIGIEVFGRSASFDAQNDPVVRIEASRLRRDLERYYLLAGQRDPIQITIPKGGYVPNFNWSSAGDRTADPKRAADQPIPRWLSGKRLAIGFGLFALTCGSSLFVHDVFGSLQEPRPANRVSQTIIVVPFEDVTQTSRGTALAAGVTDEIIGQLANLPNTTVVVAADDAKNGLIGGTRGYRFEGRVRLQEERARIYTVLLSSDGAVVWSSIDDINLSSERQIQLEANLASNLVSRLGGKLSKAMVTSLR